ncbi:aminotransferase class IV family protein [Bacillus atrophaeus subsp. globigii]|uniref:aminodeoxychorismate lyase n=1 Tax=Bacillus atrophaeus (strain 1942) TaxID=720555 RepID=A0ABM5M3L3_BACA1|nr:4-amino-4-deoxychorismate lyase [Bacillus atrophaeus 1942]AIK47586.1 aminotransferase class IV family protein [Bacillus atrophaeus subsp. globigii]EIM09224.1 4-amino-4-deoxychorismate lyase [Bacillus atrophaeus C89]KFK84736.1 aminotransferase class IV family protein [Bacillus atrophaeus]MDR4398362.1 aminodeoxychorismate lyase [Bacillus atrophaeus]
MIIYLNGQFIEEKEASLSPFDHGFLYGIGVFETFRLYEGRPFLIEWHLERLERAAKDLQIKHRITKEELTDMVDNLLRLNHIEDGNARVRLNISAGVSTKGFTAQTYENPTVLCFVNPLNPENLPVQKEGKVLTIRRNTPEGQYRLKSHHYLNNMYAKQELGNDPRYEGIFLTEDCAVAEGIISNIFWSKGKCIYTPSLDTGILDGVTRRFVIEKMEKLGAEVKTGRFRLESLLTADEAWMTNSVLEIVPFSKIEEAAFPGVSGEMTAFLQELYTNDRLG